ncbi:MarR family winged helix-turn-helix transcriptional regulator [Nocardia macrotermitis]|uniref:HTH marR-type domain-containing protein n=1 Tax=Nocardia macrotermitis TaxID=2585198 RepID=A0A7K0DCW9_9NOCA|nr:MarR family transcriptional regulator [Nocardia macrotermitis]MQY23469.1 hypothetical protein [Nocardia macrotermitis]
MGESGHTGDVLAAGCRGDGFDPLTASDSSPDLVTSLLHVTRMFNHLQTTVAERHGLTAMQSRLLCVLLTEPKGMAALADMFQVERAALTGLVDRAEQRDLVQRQPVVGDRRAVQVALTATGRQTAHAFHTEFTTEVGDLLTDIPDADRDRLRRTLLSILTNGRRPPR